jgi:hypothetical protein
MQSNFIGKHERLQTLLMLFSTFLYIKNHANKLISTEAKYLVVFKYIRTTL